MGQYYKPMLPTLVEDIPKGQDWIYEAKYDGFRCLLYVSLDRIELVSRNLKDISGSFPEIINDIKKKLPLLSMYLPLILDGEIVILESPLRADFEKIQIRGRTKNKQKIEALVNDHPAQLVAFDLLEVSGTPMPKEPLLKRKEYLLDIFQCLHEPESYNSRLKLIQYYNNSNEIWSKIVSEFGEGIVAKKKNSFWLEGSRTLNWLKIKNWKMANFFIISFEKQNGYFHVGLLKDKHIFHAGLFLHGMNEEERTALQQIMKANVLSENVKYIFIEPGICVELLFLDWYKDEIRQPRFSRFRLDIKWEECTWEEARRRSMKYS